MKPGRLPLLSLTFAALALAWGLLARARSETLWPGAVLNLVPPQVLLPAVSAYTNLQCV